MLGKFLNRYRDFFDFIVQANVFGLALGLMLGTAITEISGHLVDDIVYPLISPLIRVLHLDTNKKYKLAGGVEIDISNFSKSLMKFSIILVIAGLLVKLFQISLAPPVMAVSIVKGK